MESEPQSPASELANPPPAHPVRRKQWPYLLIPLLVIPACVWSLNFILVQSVVGRALDADPRNSGYSLSARYRFYCDPSTLVLDLGAVSAAAPLDLFRGLFQSASALTSAGRTFERVILERRGTTVFLMTGEDFRDIGTEFAGGQNPVYLIRTLPEKLFKPTGEAAFGRWEGGLLGVLGKQMEDATEAGRRWVAEK